MALSGTEKVVHSSSTMLYGALDNDDFFMYAAGWRRRCAALTAKVRSSWSRILATLAILR